MRKKKVFIHSDWTMAKTGFGRVMKALFFYLYKTNKYELINYCCGLNYSNPCLQKTPWKSIGGLPDDQREIDQVSKDPAWARDLGYGNYCLEKVLKEEKPDLYIGSQDIWALDRNINSYWWNKIPCVIWTTLDSLPILPSAVEAAKKVDNYWVWSSFAEKELHKLGHKHVKTVHGPLDDSAFHRLNSSTRLSLRESNNIPLDAFVIGFVFRNQLRKSVPNLIEGFKIFKQNNPSLKNPRLLLHTSYSEGWNINKLAGEYNVPLNEILTTYVCRHCGKYQIKNFTGEDQNCAVCHSQKSCFTCNVGKGVTEPQLNEIYNLMDVYCHPFTSGGQEIPIQEAKLTELITLVTNYSCGEELCEEGSGSMVLDWSEYREHGTEFRKASTLPSSIAKQLTKVYSMDKDKRNEQGKLSREWALKNFSIKCIGQIFENFLDSQHISDYDFQKILEEKDPQAKVEDIKDDKDWVKSLYKNILKMEVSDGDQGLSHWINQINSGMKRQDIENYFRNVASQENNKNIKSKDLSEFLDNNGNKKFLLVAKESIGDIFLITSLLKSLKEQYKDHDIYFATEPHYFEILDGNPYIHKCLPYLPQMESEIAMTGAHKNKGYFDVYCNVAIATQKQLNYLTQNKLALNLTY